VRDEADPGEDLIRLDHDLVGAVDPLDPRRTISEWRIDAGLPQIGRFEHVRVRRENEGQHQHLLSDLIASSTFGNRPIAGLSLSGRHFTETTRSFLPHPRHRSRPLRSRTLAEGLSPCCNSASGVSSVTWWQAAQSTLTKHPIRDPRCVQRRGESIPPSSLCSGDGVASSTGNVYGTKAVARREH
jgi:hypothetical protein